MKNPIVFFPERNELVLQTAMHGFFVISPEGDILKANLETIISPFAQKLFSKLLGLTPAELGVANLVRQGRDTKEIAELLGLSLKTIESYRKSIRRKLGIIQKKVNLRTHLLSFR